MGAYEELLARAENDHAVRGVILTGSVARGMATARSDHDVIVVVDEAARWSREYLDGYVNFIYRAAKNRRDGRADLARLEEMESVSWFLFTLFALHGRLRPYNKYLCWELETYPLGEPWDAATLPARLADDPAGLLPDIEELARARGHGDVLEAWGDELDLLR